MTKQEIMETLNISEEQIAMLIQINNGDAAQVLSNLERMAQEARLTNTQRKKSKLGCPS